MDIIKEIDALHQMTINHRRHLHRHPELSGKEYMTLKYIKSQLEALNIEYQHVENGGILGFINKEKTNKTILLRADIDALAIDEIASERNATYISENQGVMHACGHDGHTSMLLSAASIIKKYQAIFDGRIILCFEQGEEGLFNIRYLLKYLSDNKIHLDTCFGMHLSPYLENGQLMIQSGPVMAGLARFDIQLNGQGGHGSRSDLCKNPIDCFVDIASQLQKARLNKFDPFKPLSMSIGHVASGTTFNIIPNSLRFEGTYRYFDLEIGLKYRQLIMDVVSDNCRLNQMKYDLLALPYPSLPLINDQKCASLCIESLKCYQDDIVCGSPWMGSETFAYYNLLCNGLFIFLGSNNPKLGISADVHNANFDIDEEVLKKGVYAFVKYSHDYLKSDLSGHKNEDINFDDIFDKLGYRY